MNDQQSFRWHLPFLRMASAGWIATFSAAGFLVSSLEAADAVPKTKKARPAKSAPAKEIVSRKGIEFFENKVRPILVAHCQSCHGGQKIESGLRLDSREAALQGGVSGPAIIPNKPAESLLMEAVRQDGLQMPPDEKLADDQIASLETWIAMGAPWPADAAPAGPVLGDQKAISVAAKAHWAFQPLKKASPPTVANQAWCSTPIDAFVLARLEKEGMEPSPRADARALIRRVTFDLIGLPPRPAEVDAFVADSSPAAYAKLVDRLLASPHYGERWARHWLDIARYADTQDFQNLVDPRYPNAYTYRDYVINAINADVPYDRFVREQIAADSYATTKDDPSLAALGFLTVGPRFRNNVIEQGADRIDVVTRGLLGLTVGCARCHDHKYDPIPTADYYSLYGVFASCRVPEELPLIDVRKPPKDLYASYQKEVERRTQQLHDYQNNLRDDAMADVRKRVGDYLTAYYDMNVSKKASVRSVIGKLKLKESAVQPLCDNLEQIAKTKRWLNDPVLGPWARLIGVDDAKFSAELKKLVDGQGKKDAAPIHPPVLAMLRTTPKSRKALIDGYSRLFEKAVKAGNTPTDADLKPIAEVLTAAGGPFDLPADQCVRGARIFGKNRRVISDLENALRTVDLDHPGAPARAMVVVDIEKPVEPAIFIRGEPTRRGDRVPRRFLSIIAGPNATPFVDGSGRRELADAIVDPSNPLTARVFVNRVWMHHFGQGLVATPGDFGLRSDPPTHPELLDYLAATFMEQGWSLKALHRLILRSNVYQQSSGRRADYLQKDPDDQLLWRSRRRRLDFESMRDAMLAVSGQLDPAVGGKSFLLSDRPFSKRRSVYAFIDRVNVDALLTTFDVASSEASTPQRPETSVPQQVLFGMNHPFVVEQARAIVNAADFASLPDAAAKTRYLYGRLFGRAPDANEESLAKSFVDSTKPEAVGVAPSPWKYGYGSNDPTASAEDRFHPLKFWNGKEYQAVEAMPDRTYGTLKLSKTGGHPGRTEETAAVRRWTAPAAGVYSITGKLAHLRDRGDGVRARILAGSGGQLGEWSAFNQTVDAAVAKYAAQAGETIDFVVDMKQNPNSDTFNWAPAVELVEPAKGTVGMTRWDAARDFAGPPPPPLTPWEQVAQALLLTNEFMFLD